MTEPIIVVGGGIAGLAAAWQLVRDGVPVALYESAERVGGKLRASEIAGRIVDEGADAFLARVDPGIELARELGLSGQLISPAARKAQVWSGSLNPLPEPNVLGIPLEVEAAEAMLGAGAAAALEHDLSRTDPDPVRPNDTIGSLVRRRLGDQIHEALVDPLLGAIGAGDTDRLSLAAASPQIMAAASAGPSLVSSLRRQAAGRDADAPVFHSFQGGITVLIDALAERLDDQITTGVAVEAIERLPDGLRVTLATGEMLGASAVVITSPSSVAADLVGDWPDAAAHLRAIPLVSVAFVTLAFEAGALGLSRELSGFVVPRNDPSLRITACSYASSKWPHLGGDIDLVRVSVGHTLDQVTPDLADDELLDLVLADLGVALGVEVAPTASRISRAGPTPFPNTRSDTSNGWHRSRASSTPTGCSWRVWPIAGWGIPASIDSGRSAAVEALLHTLDQ